MAGIFGVNAPEYVSPAGAAVVTKTSGGLLGMFPGTPEYGKPEGTMSAPAAGIGGIEIRIAIPGLVNLQGSVVLPPWLPQLAPTIAPALLELVREWLARHGCAPLESPPASKTEQRPHVEQRVWDRD
jgi:hypothetical protein